MISDESRILESVRRRRLQRRGADSSGVENGSASYISGASVTGDFFGVLGVEPILAARSRRADDVIGAENVLVITHGAVAAPIRRLARRDRAPGDRSSERPFTIVGVMPPDVDYPRGVEAWMTVAAHPVDADEPGLRGVDVDLIARLRPGATIEQASERAAGADWRDSRPTRRRTTAARLDARSCAPTRTSSSATCARPCSCCSAPSGSCCSSRARTWRICCSCAARRGGRSWRCARRSAPVAAGWRASCSPRAWCWRSPRGSSDWR